MTAHNTSQTSEIGRLALTLLLSTNLLTSCTSFRDFFEKRVYTTPVWWEANRPTGEPIPVDMINGQILDVGPNWNGRRLPPVKLYIPEEEIEMTPEQFWGNTG